MLIPVQIYENEKNVEKTFIMPHLSGPKKTVATKKNENETTVLLLLKIWRGHKLCFFITPRSLNRPFITLIFTGHG